MMTIKSLEAIPVVLPLETPFKGGTYTIRNRNTIVVVVETDGARGEIYGGDEDGEQGAVVDLINGPLSEHLVGQRVATRDDIERIYVDLMNLPIDLGYRALVDLDMGRHGIHQQALSLIDIALWDALGKHLQKPVHELLGGVRRTEIPVFSIGGYYEDGDPGAKKEEVDRLREQGLSGLKMKVGRASLSEDLVRIQTALDAATPDFRIAVDANTAWTVDQALEFCESVSDWPIAWVEEPVKWYDGLTGLAQVRKTSSIPIVSGQGDISEFRSADLCLYGAVDQLNTDVTLVGGITAWMRVAEVAREHDVKMGHHEEPQVALTLLSVIDEIGPVEILADEKRDPLWPKILKDSPRPADGKLSVPTGPGLGLDLNWDLIEQYSARSI